MPCNSHTSKPKNVLSRALKNKVDGLTQQKHMMEQFLHNAEVNRSHFGNNHHKFAAQKIIPSTESGKPSDSTRLACINPNGREVTFQAGNCVPRHIASFTENPAESLGLQCLTTAVNCLKKFNLVLRFAQRVTRENTAAVDISEEPMKSFTHAINRFDAHQICQPANHQDSTVHSACAVSAFVEGGELSSKNFGGEAGLFFLEHGCAVLPHGVADVIVFYGNTYHCPLPVHPTQSGSKRKKGKGQGKREEVRVSVTPWLPFWATRSCPPSS